MRIFGSCWIACRRIFVFLPDISGEDFWMNVARIIEGKAYQDLLDFLGENKIEPGMKVFVSEKLPFNQTITVEVKDKKVALGFATAEYIFVEASWSELPPALAVDSSHGKNALL